MKLTFFLLLLFATLALSAQQPASDKKAPVSPPSPAKPEAAPPLGDISGPYSFLREGEVLQIDLEDGRVTGFVSRFGELESDRGVFLDQFFEKAALVGNKLTFTTRKIHGVWFEFSGTVERGLAKTTAEEGYYLLKGRLTQYTTDAAGKSSGRFREVIFKSFQPEPATPADPAPKKSN